MFLGHEKEYLHISGGGFTPRKQKKKAAERKKNSDQNNNVDTQQIDNTQMKKDGKSTNPKFFGKNASKGILIINTG